MHKNFFIILFSIHWKPEILTLNRFICSKHTFPPHYGSTNAWANLQAPSRKKRATFQTTSGLRNNLADSHTIAHPNEK